MAKKEYSEETKAAVLASLMEGQSVNAVAKAYKIPKGTVSSWQKRESERLNPIRQDAAKALQGEEPTTDIGALFARYLTTSLTTLIAMAEVMGEKTYIRDKGIEGVAMAYGVMTDKVVRVVEAMNRAEPDAAEN